MIGAGRISQETFAKERTLTSTTKINGFFEGNNNSKEVLQALYDVSSGLHISKLAKTDSFMRTLFALLNFL
jgi:hypothetical protein